MKQLLFIISIMLLFSCGTPAEQLLSKLQESEWNDNGITFKEFEKAIEKLDLTQETQDMRDLVFYIIDSKNRNNIRVLFENGLSMDYTNSEGENLFDVALKDKNNDLLRVYFKLNPDVNIQRSLRKHGYPLDYYYNSKSILQFIVLDEDTAEISELINQGVTLDIPIYDLAQLTKIETLKLIEKSGVDILDHHKLPLTRLETDVLREYVGHKYNLDSQQMNTLTALYNGVSRKESELSGWVPAFYEQFDNKHFMDLFKTQIDSDKASAMLKALMGMWAYEDFEGDHPLARRSFTLPPKGRSEIIIFLLEAGADPQTYYPADYMGAARQWPFKFAFEEGNEQAMEQLKEFGATPQIEDMMGALKINDLALLTYFIKLGGDVNQPMKDAFGDGGYGYSRTTYLLHQAIEDLNLVAVQMLINAEANPEYTYEFTEATDFGERSVSKNAMLIAYSNAYQQKEGAAEMLALLKAHYKTLPQGAVTDFPNSFSEYVEYGLESASLFDQAYQKITISGVDDGTVYVEGTRKNISAFLEDDKNEDTFISKGIIPYHFNGKTTFEKYYTYVTNPLSDRGEKYLPPYP